jgi:hypothetical protein
MEEHWGQALAAVTDASVMLKNSSSMNFRSALLPMTPCHSTPDITLFTGSVSNRHKRDLKKERKNAVRNRETDKPVHGRKEDQRKS